MDALRAGVFGLLVLTLPVSCSEIISTHTIVCYCLDAFLTLYCIVFTVIFFRERFKNLKAAAKPQKNCIYEELERPKDADPYQVLEPTKKKKKAATKKKPEANGRRQENGDLYESLVVNNSPPDPTAK